MNRLSFLFIVATALLLGGMSWDKRPISYLHSWNQITTLTHVSFFAQGLTPWNKPLDLVTRFPEPLRPLQIQPPYTDFLVFEELPLYHLLAGELSRSGFSPENSARILSLLLFVGTAWGIFQLGTAVKSPVVGLLTVCLYLSSFPVLYYGCAVMSDQGMALGWVWSLVFFAREERGIGRRNLCFGALSGAFSGAMKSYGLLSLVPWAVQIFVRAARSSAKEERRRGVFELGVLFFAAVPTLAWHLWTLTQAGQQEFHSHSLAQKGAVLLSWEFWNAVQKGYFRYLSWGPGVVLLLGAVLQWRHLGGLPRVLRFSLYASAVFVVATAEKIPAHDYYLLMPSVPLFLSAGLVLASLSDKLSPRQFLPLFLLLLLSMAVPSYRNLEKALGENPDVLSCAALLQERVGAEEIVAVYTDLSRYNALSYYAGRFSVRAEGSAFPVTAYKKAGATHLAVNLPQEEFAPYEGWLLNNGVQNRLFWGESLDFKGRPRVCALYSLAERP